MRVSWRKRETSAVMATWVAVGLFSLAGGTMAVAFTSVCWLAGTAWPWSQVVHEDGRRTLVETVFYFEHALRELPLDVLLGVAAGGSAFYFYPSGRQISPALDAELRRWALAFALAIAFAIAAILAGAALSVGGGAMVDNLAQMQTRPGAPLMWGAHWRYHFLERLAMILLSFAAPGILGRVVGLRPRKQRWSDLAAFGAALAAFCALSLYFGVDEKPFLDPLFLGHQARELLTHSLVTLPLTLGTGLLLARRFSRRPTTARSAQGGRAMFVGAASGLVIGSYVALGAILTDATSQGQVASLAGLVFPHFFEHASGFLVVPLVAGLCYLGSAICEEA